MWYLLSFVQLERLMIGPILLVGKGRSRRSIICSSGPNNNSNDGSLWAEIWLEAFEIRTSYFSLINSVSRGSLARAWSTICNYGWMDVRSVTRCQDSCFNIRPFTTMKICSKAKKLPITWVKSWPSHKNTSKRWHNFTKFGHTGRMDYPQRLLRFSANSTVKDSNALMSLHFVKIVGPRVAVYLCGD